MNKTTEWLLVLVIAAILLYFLLRKTPVAGATPQVTSHLVTQLPNVAPATFQPTQMGAPLEVIESLSYNQMAYDVAFWMDPGTGQMFANAPGVFAGALPLVALKDSGQVTAWYAANPQAIADMAANDGSAGPSAQAISALASIG